ncbi:MAG: transketolase family protein [Firmicutes bacterium]|nr:transketolase family protein [Bacillota bacterium]
MAEKKATRQGYGAGLAELAKKYDNVVALDADLCGSVGTKEFAKKYPERHTNAGIAEANMLGMAAGMARVGLVPFAASFAVFCPGRAFEIIRNGICYSNVNVKLCGSHSGLTSAADGGTHQAIEDIAIMRSLPNMTIFSPCDYNQAKKMVEEMYKINGPVYMRTARIATPIITSGDEPFVPGKVQTLREGKDVAVIATGIMNAYALEAIEKLAEEGIDARLVNVHTIKPFDADGVKAAVKECGGRAVVVEDANVMGGLGEAVAYALLGEPVKFAHVAVQDRFGQSGDLDLLFEDYGLDAGSIAAKIKSVL